MFVCFLPVSCACLCSHFTLLSCSSSKHVDVLLWSSPHPVGPSLTSVAAEGSNGSAGPSGQPSSLSISSSSCLCPLIPAGFDCGLHCLSPPSASCRAQSTVALQMCVLLSPAVSGAGVPLAGLGPAVAACPSARAVPMEATGSREAVRARS